MEKKTTHTHIHNQINHLPPTNNTQHLTAQQTPSRGGSSPTPHSFIAFHMTLPVWNNPGQIQASYPSSTLSSELHHKGSSSSPTRSLAQPSSAYAHILSNNQNTRELLILSQSQDISPHIMLLLLLHESKNKRFDIIQVLEPPILHMTLLLYYQLRDFLTLNI